MSQKLKTPRATALAGILFAVLFSASDGRNLQDVSAYLREAKRRWA
jgi:hypothetical protein